MLSGCEADEIPQQEAALKTAPADPSQMQGAGIVSQAPLGVELIGFSPEDQKHMLNHIFHRLLKRFR
uniref:Uncharacterized protein n=1 Tax=Sphaerodactylus townsendi TaxID=933632 RepID=A0ACB8FMB0_9SAUR